jgi:hypothetical protein
LAEAHKDGRQISIEFSIQLLKNADHAIEWVVAFQVVQGNRSRALVRAFQNEIMLSK